MNTLFNLIVVVQVLSALTIIALVLLQHGKGADMGAAFGSGGSGSLFGASGSANFLSRTTAVLAGVFFAATLMLAYFGNARPQTGTSVLEGTAITAPVPVVPGAGQIPGTAVPAPISGAVAVPPAPAASGAGQIPTK